jgi:hypothetical protein
MGVAKEDTTDRARGKLVFCSGSSVWVAQAAEDTKMCVVWCSAEQEFVGRGVGTRAAWAAIEQVCGRRKRIWLER